MYLYLAGALTYYYKKGQFDGNVPRTLVTLVMSKWHDNN